MLYFFSNEQLSNIRHPIQEYHGMFKDLSQMYIYRIHCIHVLLINLFYFFGLSMNRNMMYLSKATSKRFHSVIDNLPRAMSIKSSFLSETTGSQFRRLTKY